MSDTIRLALPLLAAAQAQKHVTHNEALQRLDALTQPLIQSRSLSGPPLDPDSGALWLVASSGTGDWSGKDGRLALWLDGAWLFLTAFEGMTALVADEEAVITYLGGVWRQQAGLIRENTLLAASSHGAETRIAVLEETLSGLSGAYVETSPLIPNRAVVFGVSTRTVTAVTGAASYDCGLAGEVSKFGGSLGISQGASNAGVIGPTAFYSDTPVRLTANGGSFTGGTVRVAVHCMLPVVPQG
ncbi:DUF2793 domain-containing protein [Roseibium litorale]|uniref:DUF2793 domain-containing protein n=1 Tax=Roseibium litorale TaxID=2803841 RepID=A0ABR9CT75_9HYPH|nr:DUF2793 domain-containing protein [Roseibium litorale]MBD8893486.1 DUF2793 domain-containing protein [Roseibium litorale]